MCVKIIIIAPFPGLAQTAQTMLQEKNGEWQSKITVASGDLTEGLNVARQAAEAGVDVIVSRGGTASLIAAHLDIPVVEIHVSAFDLLRALRHVGTIEGMVGMAGFSNVVYGCEEMGELLQIPVKGIIIENEEEAADKIRQASAAGIRVIIGDAVSAKEAMRQGLRGVLIPSGKEAVYKAVKEAELLARVRRREWERAELLKTIIDASTDGIVAIDNNARITMCNPVAEDIFQLKGTTLNGRSVADCIPNTRLPEVLRTGQAEIGEIQHVGAKVIATKRMPIKLRGEVVGVVASFQDVTQLMRYEQNIRQKLYAKGLVAKITIDKVVGVSAAMQAVKKRARQYGPTDTTVLITGESGTGKELLAQSIHNLSRRKNGPFVAVNCTALPANLLESELFGYEEGAFTGAKKGGKPGLFELAHGGTLFLDEIGEMPQALQARLLRVLQEKEVMRLGGDRIIPVDVRIVAATNQELEALVEQRTFRRDLYYRLDILRLRLPPLRERIEDIPVLAEHFLRQMTAVGKQPVSLEAGALGLLEQYTWPGNVRELQHILERAVLQAEGTAITERDIREALPARRSTATSERNSDLAAMERMAIEQVLAEENYNYTRAAARLGINRTTLWRKIKATKNQQGI